MANENDWGANPAKYKRLSKPFETEEQARVAVSAFLSDVAVLREKHRIAELTAQFQIYVNSPEGERMFMTGGAGWGDQSVQAELAKKMFDREFDHLCLVVSALAARTPGVRRSLLTDPSPAENPTEQKDDPASPEAGNQPG